MSKSDGKLTERDFPFQTIPMRMLKVVVLQSKTNSIRPSLTFYQAIVAIYILIRAALNLVATVFGWALIKLFFAALQTFQILNKLIERCWCGARKVSFVFIFFKTFINFRRLLF